MTKLTIQDLDLRGKRVFIRVDFNVPLKDGVVTDDTRIRETLPTLKLAIEKGGRLVLASHLGRPKGGPDAKYSLKPTAKKLEELLSKPVAFAADCVGPDAEAKSKALKDGYGGRIKSALETALKLDPKHADAHTAMGAYHAEIIDKVGGMIGKLTYGANKDAALEHYRQALKLNPQSPIAHIEYANGLLMLLGDKGTDEATELYDRLFVRTAFSLGEGLWKTGDATIIDGLGPDGIAAATRELAREASRLQTGYVYHYAFAMLIGVVALVTWYLLPR